MQQFLDAFVSLWNDSGLARLFNFEGGGWKNLIMIGVACVLLFLAIKKQFEPLLLLPIAFGMLLVNLPLGGVMDPQRNTLVNFTVEECVDYMEGSYEQVYPVSQSTLVTGTIQSSNGVEYFVYSSGYVEVKTYDNAAGQSVKYIDMGDTYAFIGEANAEGVCEVYYNQWQHFE